MLKKDQTTKILGFGAIGIALYFLLKKKTAVSPSVPVTTGGGGLPTTAIPSLPSVPSYVVPNIPIISTPIITPISVPSTGVLTTGGNLPSTASSAATVSYDYTESLSNYTEPIKLTTGGNLPATAPSAAPAYVPPFEQPIYETPTYQAPVAVTPVIAPSSELRTGGGGEYVAPSTGYSGGGNYSYQPPFEMPIYSTPIYNESVYTQPIPDLPPATPYTPLDTVNISLPPYVEPQPVLDMSAILQAYRNDNPDVQPVIDYSREIDYSTPAQLVFDQPIYTGGGGEQYIMPTYNEGLSQSAIDNLMDQNAESSWQWLTDFGAASSYAGESWNTGGGWGSSLDSINQNIIFHDWLNLPDVFQNDNQLAV